MNEQHEHTPTLHILNKAPKHPRFAACLGTLGAEDVLVLSENAVLGLADQQSRLPDGCLALEADLAARGLNESFQKQAISYADLVKLTEQHSRIISW
jgi:tRNA 2-thiouridine synthesizing protein B